MKLVHPALQTIRGMCTDEAPYADIDAIAAAAIESAKSLEEAVESCGLRLIAAERARQVRVKGWTAEHDDTHADGSLAIAAACYAANEPIYFERRRARAVCFDDPWPWKDHEDNRKDQSNYVNTLPHQGVDRMLALAKAGALIAAEIDRLDRASCPSD